MPTSPGPFFDLPPLRHAHQIGNLSSTPKRAVMMFRVLLLVVGAACTAAFPARAQKRGSFEIGVFAAYLNADNSLPVGNALGFGGRVGVNPFSFLAVELDIAHASKSGAGYRPMHVWFLYDVPPTSRAEVFAGIGF